MHGDFLLMLLMHPRFVLTSDFTIFLSISKSLAIWMTAWSNLRSHLASKKLNVQFSFWQVWEIVSCIQDLDMTHVPSLCQEASLEAAPSSCPWQDILQQFHGFQLSCKQSIHRSRLDRKAHRSAKSKVGSETWTKTNQKSPETKF